MRIGVPTEVKNSEHRVALTPSGVDLLTREGHRVVVQRGAGLGSQIVDAEYRAAGAEILEDAAEVWATSELIVKVKEPIADEYPYLRPDLLLFAYLHLAANSELTGSLLRAGTTAIAYETVQLPDGSLPLLAPMSEVAGRLSIVVGAHSLLRASGGRGSLLGGVPGTRRAQVVILGGGVAGEHAAANAIGLGGAVTVIDRSLDRLRALESRFGAAITTAPSTPQSIFDHVVNADLVIGSVLVPGATAPRLVTHEMVADMRSGSVLVDIAIDQGGCFEGSRPTTHDDPVFRVHDALYYCVANMPGAVPETSTAALTNATLPYIAAIAHSGWFKAAERDHSLARGLNIIEGRIMNQRVAEAFEAGTTS